MAVAHEFTKEEMEVDQSLGFPRAYAKLCKDPSLSPYIHGPPFTLSPYSLHSQEALRAKELNKMFPIIDPIAKPTAKPRIYVTLLWKQLNHLGNAGFDPAKFRVDPYGNVLYFDADSSSPLAWDIDHWFPCSRGGLTVPSNLRILQWQVCKRKHNQLEFLVPWWDLQLGISINQFLSIFAASNSDFRHRAFRWLFSGGENEELNEFQTVESHNFPQPFMESKDQIGLAPAAIVRARRDSRDPSLSTLGSLDINRQSRPTTPFIAATRKLKNGAMKENEMPEMVNTNPYQAIFMARDSLKQREEANKMKAEIQKLDDEVNELRLKNDEEKLAIQELELALIKRRRRAEKCRRLAEAQSSYKAMLEKMIRNAMHQSVVYKEQVRQNQAATITLMARLEAQKAICNSAEKELHKKFNQRDDLEKELQPKWEPRKRSRMDDDHEASPEHASPEEGEDKKTLISLPETTKTRTRLHKELRSFLEEELKSSKAALSLIEETKEEEDAEERLNEPLKLTLGQETTTEDEPFARVPEIIEEDEESRKERGRGNIEKWLQMLLEEDTEGRDDSSPINIVKDPETSRTDEIIKMLNEKYPQKEIQVLKKPASEQRNQETDDEKKNVEIEATKMMKEKCPQKEEIEHGEKNEEENVEMKGGKTRSISTPRRSISSEAGVNGKGEEDTRNKSFRGGKEKWRSESARSFRRIPSSPAIILNMRKGVDCMRKKPLVLDDDECYENEKHHVSYNLFKSPIKSIKKIVKI